MISQKVKKLPQRKPLHDNGYITEIDLEKLFKIYYHTKKNITLMNQAPASGSRKLSVNGFYPKHLSNSLSQV